MDGMCESTDLREKGLDGGIEPFSNRSLALQNNERICRGFVIYFVYRYKERERELPQMTAAFGF